MSFIRTYAAIACAAITVSAFAESPIKSDWNIRDHIKAADVIVQSHRGAGELAPENTVEAFELGWSLHTYPESDVRQTTDGVIVAFHDKNFERVVKNASPEMAKKGAEDLTWKELKKLDVGSWMGTDFVNHHVCTLDEVFTLMEGKPDRHLYLDIKKVDLKKLAKMVKKHKIDKQVVLASPTHEAIMEWKKMVPDSDTLLWVSGDTEEVQAKKYNAAKAKDFKDITQLQIHIHFTGDAAAISQDSVDPFTASDKFLVSVGKDLREKGILYQSLPYGGTAEGIYSKLLDLGIMSFATDHPKLTRTAIEDYYKKSDKAAKISVTESAPQSAAK